MRMPMHVLNGLFVALGIALIQVSATFAGGKLAALSAATGAICASLADLPLAPARTWRRVGTGALGGLVSAFLVGLLRESGAAMGLTIVLLSFCSMMTLAWGLRAGPLSFIPVLALIFTLAAPPAESLRALFLHTGWVALGALAYFCWAAAMSRLLQPRYRTLALAAALEALAALLRTRSALFSAREGEDTTPPLTEWIRSQVVLDERLQAARDLLFPAAGEPHTAAAIAALLQTVEMRDTLLAGELDVELLGHDAAATELRARLREHGANVANAIDAMARALREHGMRVPAAAAAPLAVPDLESRERASTRRAIAPAAAAAASIAASAASASSLAPGASADAALAASDAERVGAAAARAAERAPDAADGANTDAAGRARSAAEAAKAATPAREPLFASTDPRYPLAVAFHNRARQMVGVLARMQAALRGEDTPLPLSRDELQIFISPEGWPPAALRAQLRPDSAVFRHAVRMSLALGAAYFIGLALPWASHPHWLVLSVAVVLRGNLEQTLARRDDRVVGTMIGCLLVLLLGEWGPPWAAEIAFLCAVGIAHSFVTARYLVTSAAASVMALTQAHMAAPDQGFGVFERIADTLIGAALAWGFSYVWPWWERRGIGLLAERVLASLGALAKEIMCVPEPAKPDLQLRLARREVYEAVGAIASAAQRTSAEPESVRVPMYALAEMLTRSHVLMAQLASVRLLLARRAPQFEGTDAPQVLAAACASLQAALERPDAPTSAQRGAPGAAGAPVVVPGTVPSEDIDHTAVPAALPDSAVLPWLQRRLNLATRAARRVGMAAQALNAAAR